VDLSPKKCAGCDDDLRSADDLTIFFKPSSDMRIRVAT